MLWVDPFSVGVISYYWWDCFTAQQEGGASIFSNNNWQAYGWRPGGPSISARHEGGRGDIGGFDPLDSDDWNWQALIIYIHCEDGHMHVRYKISNMEDFTWIKDANAWGNYPYSPTQNPGMH